MAITGINATDRPQRTAVRTAEVIAPAAGSEPQSCVAARFGLCMDHSPAVLEV